MAVYIYQLTQWPHFEWDSERLATSLGKLRYQHGKLLGRMESLGFSLRQEASLENLTLDVVKSSEIEGERLSAAQVRSSIGLRLGIDVGGVVPADRNVEGIVEVMMDATQHYKQPLTRERIFGWHAALFPMGYSGKDKITVGAWRTDKMQVVSGPEGRKIVHFEALGPEVLEQEMEKFLEWLNGQPATDPVIKAAIAHFWFVTIHPFDDGNGRIARAIADRQLVWADETPQRFYSMSAQIHKEKDAYYKILEETQKGTIDITEWLEWFLGCLGRALANTSETLAAVLAKKAWWDQHSGRELNERQLKMINKMLDDFKGKMTSSKWASLTKTSHDTALRDIQDLVVKGVLVREASGGRSTSYVLEGTTAVLTGISNSN